MKSKETKKTNITEKYGACIQLKMIIETMQKSLEDSKNGAIKTPGQEYLIKLLSNLYIDINNEIFEDFAGVINGINKIVQDSKNDIEGSSADD